jgi:membrane protein DedA with SNARE-associated domain
MAIFVLMVLESAAIPVPSELVMTFGGFLAIHGHLNLAEVVAAGVVGNVVGSYIAWLIGRYVGRAVILSFGRYLLIKEDDLAKAERWFEKRGELAVFVGRLLPVVRTFISIPAGAGEMRLVRFGLYTLLGSIPFDLALAVAGYELGSNYSSVVRAVQDSGYVIAVLVVLVVVAFFYVRFKQKKNLAGSN